MDNYKNNKQNASSSSLLLQQQQQQQRSSAPTEDLTRISSAFEYSFPTSSEADDEDNTKISASTAESNSSTPYYTPLEFFQSSFEFPSPKWIDQSKETPSEVDNSITTTESHTLTDKRQLMEESDADIKMLLTTTTPKPYSASAAKQLQSPGISNRKLRRFTFNERRSCSCSPQHLLSRNSSVECPSESAAAAEQEQCIVMMDVDKENTKPKYPKQDKKDGGGSDANTGNNSPIVLYDESSGSPKIFTASDASSMLAAANAANNQRHTPYSPKLLASINNLNLSGGGSPLSVISSAGYKHGNYFKFPEIDHIVQENSLVESVAQIDEYSSVQVDNQLRNRQKRLGNTSPASPITLHLKSRFKSSSLDIENIKASPAISADGKNSELAPFASQDGINLKSAPIELSKSSATANINIKSDARKMRKNKNNLTIRITDVQQCTTAITPAMQQQQPPSSPSPKPKTPTIKSTKEKALSLDSAAAAGETRLTIPCGGVESHAASYDEIDAQALRQSGMPPPPPSLVASSSLKQRSSNYNSRGRLRPELVGGGLRNPSVVSIRSTSLSQLTAPSLVGVGGGKALSSQRSGETILCRSNRRRVPGTPNNEWLQYHRKQNPFKLNQNIITDPANKAALDAATAGGTDIDLSAVTLLKEDDEIHAADDVGKLNSSHIQSTPSSSTSTSSFLLTTTPTHRGIHKHNPILHASNTNLKTLPEFLTLVEFSTTSGSAGKEHAAYKQKSIDLPSSTLPPPQPMVTHSAGGHGAARTKNITSTSSNNLLQRRGSNHSLTLNLHGSCSNLLGSCRSGFSVSNYSLGSVANSTNNLNSKSSCNLNVSNANTPHSVNVIHQNIGTAAAAAVAATTQDAKQSLFRRGSNYSLSHGTNLTATSCGNLNSFASQNSLNVDRSNLGVTRTTSFITPTNNTNTSSSVTPKRGLLERRGSNQSFTLNMSSSFGGIGSEQNAFAASHLYLGDAAETTESQAATKATPSACCAAAVHQRKFFSSESLNRANTQFSDLNQAHKRNAKQVCFGSVSDLKPNHGHEPTAMDVAAGYDYAGGAAESARRNHFNFQESTICSCTGVRNIATRPLSPQTTSEEFKIYLANVQMLQNASNALNQLDLIKLNYIFDNSYATSNSNSMVDQPMPLLSIPSPPNIKESDPQPGLLSTSEDSELAARYLAAVCNILPTIQPDDNEQKRMFRDLHKEFWDLPLNHQEKPMVFGSQTKNRYKTILPNENSRVLLDRECKQLADHITETNADITENVISKQFSIADEVPYINANYIKGPDYTSKCYIATQGPLPNTIFEFWLMIYQNTHKHFQMSTDKTSSPQIKAVTALQQYYQKIVMLTSILENNRQKCSVYFPVELNEIFITTYKQEVMPPSETVIDFFEAYLKTSDNAAPPPPNYISDDEDVDFESTRRAAASVETFKVDVGFELSQKLWSTTSPPANFFVLKNIGIVKKNGFSIRKLVVLYCIHLPPTTDSNMPPHQLLVHKFYCFHYWYPDWPDHRSPRDINTLLDITLHILNLGKCETEFDVFSEDKSPALTPDAESSEQQADLFQQDIFNAVQPQPVIHCSAGIGRTGCLTAILNGVRQLRQSLAYSLTSMATTASKASPTSAAVQLLSPVDFCLPAEFLKEICRPSSDGGGGGELHNDTDSSFTRATFHYIKYIKRMHKQQNEDDDEEEFEVEKEEDDADETLAHDSLSQMTTALSELPKLPDVFVDILGIVCNLRLQRGGMVQNSEQYELIYRAVCLYLKRTFALKRF